MKKYFSLLVLVLVSLFGFSTGVSAKSASTNLVEAVNEEINYFGDVSNFDDQATFEAYQEYVTKLKAADLSNYEESDNKVTIYIFRGKTCWHCLDEITWLAEHYNEYSKYVNVKTFEVWNNKTNSKLMNLVAKHFSKQANGVPFTVVGDETYSGFTEEIGSKMIEKAIEQYNSEEKYDIKNYIDLDEVLSKTSKSKSNAGIILLIVTVLVGGGVLVYLVSKSK